MRNLFSVFSPDRYFGLGLNWIVLSLCPLVALGSYWALRSEAQIRLSLILYLVQLEFTSILGRAVVPGAIWVLVCLFGFVCVNNFLGLLPFVFTASSHLRFTLALALPLWAGHTVISWIKQPSYALAHLVPVGTPPALLRFMVLIELLRRVIRPVTLSVRLAANIVAGHLLFVLLSSQAFPSSVLRGLNLAVLRALILLGVLETAVALIQGYVFSLLRTLYVQEVQTKILALA